LTDPEEVPWLPSFQPAMPVSTEVRRILRR
jgi:hypothetical protein